MSVVGELAEERLILVSDPAVVLPHGVDRAANLSVAMQTRDVIGQAKGILTERSAVDADTAFRMLVRSSQDTNLRPADVARWLVVERANTAHRSASGDRRAGPGSARGNV